MLLLLRFITIMMVLMIVQPAWAGMLEDAIEAGNQGDIRTEFQLFQILAEQGNAFAQYKLGSIYRDGLAVTRDYNKSIRWYRLAIDQDEPNAEFNLGVIYESGEGVPKNHPLAARLYRMAADQGHPSAQTNLGTMYADGDGVPKDLVQAYLWASLAAAAGVKVAEVNRNYAATLMTPAEITQAQHLARIWRPTRH